MRIQRPSGSGVAAESRRRPRPIIYPESDGKPMAETDIHRDEMVRLIDTLRLYYTSAPEVYVSGNLLLYYEEGNPHASISPDVFVVKGVAKHPRRTYLLWQEGVPPSLVIEVTSPKTARQDRNSKWDRYTQMGVQEYIFYDPEGVLKRRPLEGFRRDGDRWQPLPEDAAGRLISEQLGLRLELVDPETGERVRPQDTGRREGLRLELVDPATGRRLPNSFELARAEAEARLAAEQRASAAEARLAALEASWSEHNPPSPQD